MPSGEAETSEHAPAALAARAVMGGTRGLPRGAGVAQRSREAQYKCSEKASLGIGGRRLGGSICGNVLVIHEPSRHSTNARCAETAITPDCHGRLQFSANPRKFSCDGYLVPIPVRFGGIVWDEKIHTPMYQYINIYTHSCIYKYKYAYPYIYT